MDPNRDSAGNHPDTAECLQLEHYYSFQKGAYKFSMSKDGRCVQLRTVRGTMRAALEKRSKHNFKAHWCQNTLIEIYNFLQRSIYAARNHCNSLLEAIQLIHCEDYVVGFYTDFIKLIFYYYSDHEFKPDVVVDTIYKHVTCRLCKDWPRFVQATIMEHLLEEHRNSTIYITFVQCLLTDCCR